MSGQNEPVPEALLVSAAESVASETTFADRVDILYRLGRHYLFLPFSALCVSGVLYKGLIPIWFAIIPFLLQITVTIATGRLTVAAEDERAGNEAPTPI